PAADEIDWHRLEATEVTRILKTDARNGLGSGEALSRLKKFGPNAVTVRAGMPAWRRFLRQFHQPLVYLLLSACAVTAALHEWVDSGVIFGVVLVNALIGFLQEGKAERALAALGRMVRTETKVRRDGQKRRIASVD